MAKKTILINCLAYVSGRAPGFNNYLINTLDSILDSLGEEYLVTLVIRADQSEEFVRYRNTAKIVSIRCRNLWERVLKENFLLPILSLPYDLTIFPGNISPVLYFKKHILVVCDLNFLSFPKNFTSFNFFLRSVFQRLCLKRANQVVSISEVVRKEIFDYCSVNSRVIYVPTNIKSTISLLHEKRTYRLIVVPSSLAVHKNVHAAYKAAINIVAEHSDIKFIFFGAWNKNDFIVDDESSSVQLLGRITNEKRDAIFESCDAILVPSIYEGFGMPYAEAMLLKIPLICCDIPIAREIVGAYPFYIPDPFDSKKIEETLLAAISDGLPQRVFDQNLIDRYTIKAVGNEYGQLIRQLS